SKQSVSRDGLQGREWTLTNSRSYNSTTLTVQVFVVGKRLYILIVSDAEYRSGPRFLNSFRVDTPGRANLPLPHQVQSLIADWSFDKVQGEMVSEDTGRLLNPLPLHRCRLGDGVRGKGLQLSGNADTYFEYGAARDLNFAAGDAFTICGWFKTPSLTGVLVS